MGIPYTHQKSPIKPYWSPIKPYWRCIIRGFQKCWYPNQSLNISLNHSNSFNWNGELSWSFIQTHHISTFGAFPIQQTSYHHLSSIWVFQDFPLKKKHTSNVNPGLINTKRLFNWGGYHLCIIVWLLEEYRSTPLIFINHGLVSSGVDSIGVPSGKLT